MLKIIKKIIPGRVRYAYKNSQKKPEFQAEVTIFEKHKAKPGTVVSIKKSSSRNPATEKHVVVGTPSVAQKKKSSGEIQRINKYLSYKTGKGKIEAGRKDG